MKTREESLFVFLQERIDDSGIEMEENLRPETRLIESGLIDSLALLELAGWIESEVGRTVNLTEVDPLKEWDTPRDILNFIEKNNGHHA